MSKQREPITLMFDPALCSERHKRIWQMVSAYTVIIGAILFVLYGQVSSAQARAAESAIRQEQTQEQLRDMNMRLTQRLGRMENKIDEMLMGRTAGP